jgi:hypothetical protein
VTEQLVLRGSGRHVPKAQRGEGRRRHLPRVGHAGQPHEADTVGEPLRGRAGGLQGQAGLADPAGTGDGDQPRGPQQLADPAQVAVPAQERREPRRQPAPYGRAGGRRRGPGAGARSGGSQVRPLLQDRLLHGAQLRSRGQAELGVEHGPGPLVDRERVGLPAGAVEGEHETAVRALAQRVGPGELLQLTEHLGVPAGGQLQVDQRFPRGHSQLGQPGRLRPRPRRAAELDQRRSAPGRQRLPVEPRGRDRVAVGGGAGGRHLVGEAQRIDAVTRKVEHVAGRTGRHQLARRPGGGQRPAQLRHPNLERIARVHRQGRPPQAVHQDRNGDHPPGRERQQREQLPLATPGHRPSLPVDDDLDRPEDTDVHTAPSPQRVRLAAPPSLARAARLHKTVRVGRRRCGQRPDSVRTAPPGTVGPPWPPRETP